MGTCYDDGAEMLRTCAIESSTEDRITAIDQYTGCQIVMWFIEGLNRYCWGQRVPCKFIFYFDPEDYAPIAQALGSNDCIAFHYNQVSTFRLSDTHWFYA